MRSLRRLWRALARARPPGSYRTAVAATGKGHWPAPSCRGGAGRRADAGGPGQWLYPGPVGILHPPRADGPRPSPGGRQGTPRRFQPVPCRSVGRCLAARRIPGRGGCRGVRPVEPALLRRCLMPDEYERVIALPPRERLAEFFQAWTAKEARLKGTGVGLATPLDSVPAAPPDGWSLAHLWLDQNHLVAMCAEQPAVPPRRAGRRDDGYAPSTPAGVAWRPRPWSAVCVCASRAAGGEGRRFLRPAREAPRPR